MQGYQRLAQSIVQIGIEGEEGRGYGGGRGKGDQEEKKKTDRQEKKGGGGGGKVDNQIALLNQRKSQTSRQQNTSTNHNAAHTHSDVTPLRINAEGAVERQGFSRECIR